MIFFRIGLFVCSILLGLSVQAKGELISLSAQNEPLGGVLKRIASVSGVDVVLADKKWAKTPVSFSVKSSEFRTTLDSVLRAYNYTVEWYPEGNGFSKVVVRIHERKDIRKSETQVFTADSQPIVKKSDLPLTGQELTNFMAQEIARRMRIGYRDTVATPELLERGAAMKDMIDRIGNTKNKE